MVVVAVAVVAIAIAVVVVVVVVVVVLLLLLLHELSATAAGSSLCDQFSDEAWSFVKIYQVLKFKATLTL